MNITHCDLKALLRVVFNIGLHPLPDEVVKQNDIFSDVLSKDQFLLLLWNLHFSNDEEKDCVLRIWAIVNYMKEK